MSTDNAARIASLRSPIVQMLEGLLTWQDGVATYNDPLYAGPCEEIKRADEAVLDAQKALVIAAQALAELAERANGKPSHQVVTDEAA